MGATLRNRKNGLEIMVTHLPQRKLPALVVREHNVSTLVAYFKDEEAARLYVKILEAIIYGK